MCLTINFGFILYAFLLCCEILLCLGQNYGGDTERHFNDTRIKITWCTISKHEQQKCNNFAMAVERDRVRVGYDVFKIECYHAFNKLECMQLLDAEKVTFTSLDAGEVFVGGRFHSLVPIAQEVSHEGFNFNYAVAVIKKNTLKDVTSLKDLRNKSACFAGVGTLAGWIIPVYTLMKEGGMEIIDCNNHVKSATNFFGPSCAVNALTDKYNPIGDNSDKLCSLCIGKVPGGKCTDSDPYSGFEGAFRCLLESGEIAFLKHYTVGELTGSYEFSAVSKDSFELLCKDGTRRPIDDYRSCNWGTVPTNAIVTTSASSPELRRKYQKFLNKVAQFYAPRNRTYDSNDGNRHDDDRNQYDDNPEYDRFGNRVTNNNRYKRQNYGEYGRGGQNYDPYNRDGNTQNRDYNREQQDRNDPYSNDRNPYSQNPSVRDPYLVNSGQYGVNIDPYGNDATTFTRDREPDYDRRPQENDYHNGSYYETFNLFESAPRYGIHNNLLVQDTTRRFNALDENMQTYSAFLGSSLDLIMGVRDCPVNRMTLCVTSDMELEKCIKMRTALKAQLLKPEMVCYKGHSQINCMQAIRSGTADVTVLDASDVYTAGLSFDLVPFISEVYNLGKPEYYVVAVAKESDPDTEITYLKGKYTCHGGINTAAGWVYPLAYLLSNGWMRPYGCDSIRAAAEYFSKSCIPGAISTEYNTGVPYDNMCHLCHGASYRYCRRDASEDYYGHTGAFRCLVEGGGHVAFVKHTTVIENTGGKRREWWARDALMDDFELMCPDGTRAEVNDYEKCNLGKVKANAIVTRGGYAYNNTQINAYINLFLYSQTFYGKKIPDEFSSSSGSSSSIIQVIQVASTNMANLRTVYAFAREMHPKTEKNDIEYGTAGFRTKASKLGYVMYRMGLLAVLRARYKKAVIGVMITASHNPEPDNGVKLVDPQGEMLEQSWEKWATKFANVGDDQLEETINAIVKEYNIDMTNRVEIYVGKDTRPSSPSLSKSLTDGILALSGKPMDFGIVTTPQLHYFVKCRNSKHYGIPTEEGYYSKLVTAFKKLRGDDFTKGNYKNRIFYDGANGVGAKKIKYLQERIGECMVIQNYNDASIGSGKLNYMCGADFVKSHQAFPTGVPVESNVRCVSVDGDADRIVYYYMDENEKFHLMDGDRIATLIASYLKKLLKETGIDLNLGLIQTAYANGASTEYITNQLKVPVACVPTGVKHLHHKALEYDIGVYFEANGHGTVVFSDLAKETLRNASIDESLSESKRKSAENFLVLIDLINETVGDALSDMLLVETILKSNGWDIQDWEACYVDYPNKLMKVVVKDRNVITTTDAERKCVTPNGLQDKIDEFVNKYNNARSFVRPSGTEDIVRVYAEAATAVEVDKLIAEVALAVYEMAGGTGGPPVIPTE